MLDDDGANKIFFTVFSKLISFTFLPFLYLTFVGDDLIVFFLGSKWEATGVFIRILAVGYFFRLVFSTNDYIFAYKNKQNYNLIMNVLLAAVTVISLFIGYYFESVEIALFLMTVSNSFVLFFFSLKLFIWCGFTAREFISIFLIEFKILVVYLFLLLILKYVLKVNFILLAIYLVLSIIFRQRKYFLAFNTKR
jgi:O-antigen/teichoic acid export membrane protein